jgi:hypothetical protein
MPGRPRAAGGAAGGGVVRRERERQRRSSPQKQKTLDVSRKEGQVDQASAQI